MPYSSALTYNSQSQLRNSHEAIASGRKKTNPATSVLAYSLQTSSLNKQSGASNIARARCAATSYFSATAMIERSLISIKANMISAEGMIDPKSKIALQQANQSLADNIDRIINHTEFSGFKLMSTSSETMVSNGSSMTSVSFKDLSGIAKDLRNIDSEKDQKIYPPSTSAASSQPASPVRRMGAQFFDDDERPALEQEIHVLKEQVGNLEQEIAFERRDCLGIERRIEDVTAELERTNTELKDIDARLGTIKIAIANQLATNKDSLNKLHEAGNACNNEESSLASKFRRAASSATTKVAEKSHELTRLEGIRDAANFTHKANESKLAELNTVKQGLESRKKILTNQHSELLEANRNFSRQLEQKRQNILDKTTILDDLKERIAGLEMELAHQDQKINFFPARVAEEPSEESDTDISSTTESMNIDEIITMVQKAKANAHNQIIDFEFHQQSLLNSIDQEREALASFTATDYTEEANITSENHLRMNAMQCSMMAMLRMNKSLQNKAINALG